MTEQHSGASRAEATTVHPGFRDSFARIEAQAREVLREQGFSEAQIDVELNRSKGDDSLAVPSIDRDGPAASAEQHSN